MVALSGLSQWSTDVKIDPVIPELKRWIGWMFSCPSSEIGECRSGCLDMSHLIWVIISIIAVSLVCFGCVHLECPIAVLSSKTWFRLTGQMS